MDLLKRDLRPPLSGPAPPAAAENGGRRPALGPFTGLLLFLAGVTAARLAYLGAGVLDLSPDEAHYWEWSRRLDLSYYSKGPLVAYLIRGLTTVFGHSALAIRLGAVLLSVAGALVLYRLGREAFGDPQPGLLAVIGLQLTPLFWAGSLVMTIDPPFLVLWSLALLFLWRALVGGARSAWLLAGLAVGLGLLAKYTMLFVVPGLALYLWRAPAARGWLRRPAPYLAAGLALLLFVPVVVWNLEHGWVTARHVASQGRGAGLTLVEPFRLVGSQVAILTPLVAGILGWAVWYGVREGLARGREPYRFLIAFAAPVLLFYLVVSLQGKAQANWPAPAYPSLGLVAGGALLQWRRQLAPRGRRAQTVLVGAAAVLALAVSVVGHATDLAGIPPALDPTTRLKGWRELGATVSRLHRAMPVPERAFLLADRYQITSELAFYVEGNLPAYNVNLGRRLNQYDFWEGPDARRGWDAIYVREGAGEPDARILAAFERTEGPVVVEVRRGGRPVRVFAVYRGYNFRGVPPPSGPTTY